MGEAVHVFGHGVFEKSLYLPSILQTLFLKNCSKKNDSEKIFKNLSSNLCTKPSQSSLPYLNYVQNIGESYLSKFFM